MMDEDPKCAHGVPLVSRIGGPSNYCRACERAGKIVFPSRDT